MNRDCGTTRPRPAALLAWTLVTLAGCATARNEVRPGNPPAPTAPDLLNVSAVAPGVNAGPTAIGRRSREVVATASAVVQAAMPRPSVAENSGLMGPTPPLATPAASTPPTIPQSAGSYPIDLAAALRLADDQNPVIGEARVLILGALAERQAARVLLLPDLNAGVNYHDHTGPLQRSAGTIQKITEQSFYLGGGAGALAGNTVPIPAVNIFSPLTDAIFEPLAAQQRVVGARYNASDTANKVLLEVAALYIDLIGANAILEARRETAAAADRVAESVAAFAATGQGRKSDAERADANRRLYQLAIQRAEEQVAVASAVLAQRLNLNPAAQLVPLAGPLEPIELINPDTPSDELIRSALRGRPDLAARNALVSQAEYRVKQEKGRPLLPTLWLGFSGGAFGGGSNLTSTPLGSFAGRTDFDVRLYWTVLNLGAGNLSLVKQRQAQAGQLIAARSSVLNQIRAEVTSARAEALALRSQVSNARNGLKTADDGYRQDKIRLRESLSLPIEALDSLRLLADARVALIEAITRANRAQFALFVALGAPPPLQSPLSAVPPGGE